MNGASARTWPPCSASLPDLGWNEQIGNHNSPMLPGDRPTFPINPRVLLFQEITASSLIVCDLDGNVPRGSGELR